MIDAISIDEVTYAPAVAPLNQPFHVVFAGGGTGGHLFPGLAVADALKHLNPHVKITFAGTGSSFERTLVSRSGHEYLAIRSRPLPRAPWHALGFVRDNLAGYRAASRYLQENQVNVVVGLGGYASVPTARAAIKQDVPLVLLEQNVVPGRATSWLAPSAEVVCASFPQVQDQLRPGSVVEVTGNPLRREFARLRQQTGPRRSTRTARTEPFRLVVLGGSGGAEALNTTVPKALYKLRTRLRDWQIMHQTGPHDVDATREMYRKLGLKAVVVPFIEKMAFILEDTDLAISRAGGTVLAELAATGVPAVLVPYPAAIFDHQRKNADLFAAAQAAVTVDPREVTGRLDDSLVEVLSSLLLDTQLRKRMSQSMHGFARPKATEEVAALVVETALAYAPAGAR